MSRLQKVLGMGAAVAFGITCLAVVPLNASAAENRYYSEITTAEGDAGEQTLLDKNYSVFHPMLQNAKGEPLWLGYQTTADRQAAVTSLRREANGGFAWNKDSAKPAVLSVYFMSAGQDGFDQLMPIPNNGAVAMPDANGDPAVFQTANGQGYLAVVYDDVWKSYIGSLSSATASSKKEAVTQLYKSGCDYYIDQNFSQDTAKSTYLGYSRTSDPSKAITDIIASNGAAPAGYEKAGGAVVPGRELYVTRSEAYGNPILDLEPFEGGQGTELTASKLAMMIASNGDNRLTKPYVLQSEAYQKLNADNSAYLLSNIICEDGAVTGLSFASSGDKLADKQKARYALLGLGEPGNNGSLTVDGDVQNTTVGETEPDATEQDGEAPDTTAPEAEEQTTYDNSAAGTAYADPGDALPPLPAIIIPSVIAVLIPVVTLILRKRILKGKGDKDEKA